ncbi:MAG: hypothetical protein MUF21_03760 [Gemmatimonadaceae bacterium]|nr:hypothetical protein [Gemmatimonadaceae bacterium]
MTLVRAAARRRARLRASAALIVALAPGVPVHAAPAVATPRPAHASSARARAAHEFHVSHVRIAVEGATVTAVARIFTDDLLRTLLQETKGASITLGSAEAHAALQRYVARTFPLRADGRPLVPRVLDSGEDRDMWWIALAWDAPAPVRELRFHVALLFDVFRDQQNIVKLLHVPTRHETSHYFAGGATDDRVVTFR